MITHALPCQVTFYLNYVCNLRCRFCYLHGDRRDMNAWMKPVKTGQISFDLFKKVALELLENEPRTSFFLMGGEPYLNQSLPAMVALVKSVPGAYIDINTNGTLLEEKGEPVLASGIDGVYISLDGSKPEINDALRGAGSFERVTKGIRHHILLRDKKGYRVRLAINHTITSMNIDDLPEMGRLTEDLGLDELFVNLPVFYTSTDGSQSQQLFAEVLKRPFESWKGFQLGSLIENVDPEKLKSCLDQLVNINKHFDLYIAPVGYSNRETSMYFGPTWKSLVRQTSCTKLYFRTTILPNGDVIPCTIFPDLVVGNVSEQSLRSIWQGNLYGRFRTLLKNRLAGVCYRCCDLVDETSDDPFAFIDKSRESYVCP